MDRLLQPRSTLIARRQILNTLLIFGERQNTQKQGVLGLRVDPLLDSAVWFGASGFGDHVGI
jgi:hypothetical protein